MWPSVQDWLSALTLILPAYCTNGAPVLFGGGKQIDFGRTFVDGKRIFGSHKTFRGLFGGIAVGVVVGLAESYVFSMNLLLIAVAASVGALLGDLAGAFLKRRLGIVPGGVLPVVDQLDFVVGAILLVSVFSHVSLAVVLIMVLVTPPIHLLTNVGAYVLRLKTHPW
ncbi:MAG TPA: CDP-2,3-bis-(O-geranylgeranyl)-sn-glycerol synthase [Candidatus Acidoferrales bacterium]|nr:CDP-2,3-bis-(O-geranylgeranyl)-sn-glycerol synthase [Candidatus Acidoferrales bacterium]